MLREVETTISGDRPELDKIIDPRLRRLFADPAIIRRLGPLFATDFRRTAWPLRFKESLIELAFDRGEIRAEDASLPLCEIELELKSGRPEHLFELALAVHELLPVTLGGPTKAERGYALLAGSAAGAGQGNADRADGHHERARCLRGGGAQLPGADARQREPGAAG